MSTDERVWTDSTRLVPEMAPGEEVEIQGIRSTPPGRCPVLDPIQWSDSPPDSSIATQNQSSDRLTMNRD